MKFLRKILLGLAGIIVLAFLKPLFSKLFPASVIFHYNLISSMQLLILFWSIITGLLETIFRRKLPPSKAKLLGFSSFLVLIAMAEAGCGWMIYHPSLIPGRLQPCFHYFYSNYQRNILQYDDHTTLYDAALFYKMKRNNSSVFSNVEFSDSIFTDTWGFRDRENAANHSRILCLGDSYTLGWGVGQNETYPSRLEKILGTPVLNTGMSSYGTAREVASVRPLDKSAISTVIIQYCPNDADENEACANNGFRPVISGPRVYDSAVTFSRWSTVWFPGKYFCTLLKLFLAEKTGAIKINEQASASQVDPGEYDKEAGWFLGILQRSGFDSDKTRIFVFEIDAYTSLNGKFIRALETKLADPACDNSFRNHIHPLHIENLFTPADYYILDEHLRPSGQLKLAQYLAKMIRANEN